MKRFVGASHLAFQRHICRAIGIAFLSAVSARHYVFSTSHRGLVHSIDCCVNITEYNSVIMIVLVRLHLVCIVNLTPIEQEFVVTLHCSSVRSATLLLQEYLISFLPKLFCAEVLFIPSAALRLL